MQFGCSRWAALSLRNSRHLDLFLIRIPYRLHGGWNFGGYNRPAEDVTLNPVGPHIPEHGYFVLRFGTFGDYRQVERMAELDHSLEQWMLTGVGANSFYESTVNLQFIEGQTVEIGQRGLASAKVVDCEFDADDIQSGKHIAHAPERGVGK